MKTRMAYGVLKSTGKLIMSQDTIKEALKVKMFFRDYEKQLIQLNPQLEITFKVVEL